MNFVWKQRVRQYWPFVVVATAVAIIGLIATILSLAATTNSTVDFTKATTKLAAKPFSGTISTYAEGGSSIITSDAQRTTLAHLGLGYYRLPLQWNGGNIVSSAGGHPGGSGDAWVSSIKAIGGEPQIVLGGSADNNFSAADAANMVRHFNKDQGGANRVAVWVIGNEPGNGGMDIATYCNLFVSSVDAMKAVDPTIKVAGPAWAYFDMGTLRSFLQCAGSKVDIIDYHHYAMGEKSLDTATALSQTGNWETEVRQARQAITEIVPSRADQIEIQVGEYNWSWRSEDGYAGWQGDDRFYQSINTVWGASVAGHIAKAGGRGHQYADLNGALGITFEKNDAAAHYGRKLTDPMPIYYGMQMFTGGNLFRGFGTTMVEATTELKDVEIYAADNKNIVVINKSPTTMQPFAAKLTGFNAGTADIWQTNKDAPFSPPVKRATVAAADTVAYDLPPYSVTTFVLNAGTQAPTPPPTTEPTPTTPAPTPTPPPATDTSLLQVPIRINAGGGQYTDTSGAVWRTDVNYDGGNTDNQAAGRTIAGTDKQALYQDERWGNFSYHIPLAKGSYKVRLHFAEIYTPCGTAGCRVFNVTAEDTAWLNNFDISSKVPVNTAYIEEKTVTLTDNDLDLAFTGVVGSPQLAAIEVLAADTATTPPSTGGGSSSQVSGLRGEYYANKNLSGKPITRTDKNIDFSWGKGSPVNGIPADGFSARWTGGLTVPKTGTYTFYLTGDDGVRMWIDGQQVINGWRDQSSREYQASVWLGADKSHEIRVEYYENYVDAVARLQWSSQDMTKRVIPASAFSSSSNGLKATYYQYKGNGVFGDALFSEVTPVIDNSWGNAGPGGSAGTDRFGVTWAGTLVAPTSGQYTLATLSDDGVRLWLDDKLLIDDWSDHAQRRDQAVVTLQANQAYSIKVSYYENYGDAVMRLLWRTPGQASDSIVPQAALRYQ